MGDRILAIHVTRIGDTLMTTPSLRALAEAYPGSDLTFLGHPKRAELIRNLPFVSRVRTITKQRAPWRARLGGARYDLALVWGYDEALVHYALRTAGRVVAFRQASPALNSRLAFSTAQPAFNTLHGVDLLLTLPGLLGIRPSSRALAYRVSAGEAAQARERLSPLRGEARPLVGFVVESFPTKPYRDWAAEHFAELARRILLEYGRARFLLLGGALSARKAAVLNDALGPRLTTFAGRLSLRETAAVMAELDLYVGVDTGPTHLAGALRIPMVALYHCKHPARCLAPPEHPRLTAIDHPAVDTDACGPERSMSEIPVDRVWAAVRERLREAMA